MPPLLILFAFRAMTQETQCQLPGLPAKTGPIGSPDPDRGCLAQSPWWQRGGGPPGLGAQLNGEQSPHSYPTTKAPKSPCWGPLPAADRPEPRELQTSSTNQQRHLVAVTGPPAQATSARPAWTPSSATRAGSPGQCAQPDRPGLPTEASGPPRGLQGSCHTGGSPLWFPAPVDPWNPPAERDPAPRRNSH